MRCTRRYTYYFEYSFTISIDYRARRDINRSQRSQECIRVRATPSVIQNRSEKNRVPDSFSVRVAPHRRVSINLKSWTMDRKREREMVERLMEESLPSSIVVS